MFDNEFCLMVCLVIQMEGNTFGFHIQALGDMQNVQIGPNM